MTLRLDEEHARKLGELAQRSGTSKHDAVLRAIDEEFNRMTHRQRVTDATQPNRWSAGGTHLSDSASNTMPCEFLSLEDLLDMMSARRYQNGQLRAHEARVAREQGQEPHAR